MSNMYPEPPKFSLIPPLPWSAPTASPSAPAAARDDPENNEQHNGAYSRVDDMGDGNAVKIKGPTQRPGSSHEL